MVDTFAQFFSQPAVVLGYLVHELAVLHFPYGPQSVFYGALQPMAIFVGLPGVGVGELWHFVAVQHHRRAVYLPDVASVSAPLHAVSQIAALPAVGLASVLVRTGFSFGNLHPFSIPGIAGGSATCRSSRIPIFGLLLPV